MLLLRTVSFTHLRDNLRPGTDVGGGGRALLGWGERQRERPRKGARQCPGAT